jgi:NADPH-dependent curcumin reductase CurA
MSSGTYTSVVLAERPKDNIVPGKTFKVKTQARPTEADLKDGTVLVEALYLSLDPAMRGWLNGKSHSEPYDHVIVIRSPDARSYVPPVAIGEVMRGAIIGKVLASKSSKFAVGDYVNASSGWSEIAIVSEKELSKLDVPANGKVTDALGVLGMERHHLRAPNRFSDSV